MRVTKCSACGNYHRDIEVIMISSEDRRIKASVYFLCPETNKEVYVRDEKIYLD